MEVAAAEALDGPTPEDLEAIRAATFTVEAVKEREKVTDHDVAGVRRRAGGLRGPGRALDPLRADVLRRARHGARAAAPAGGRADRRRRARARLARWPSEAREHAGHAVRRPHPRRARRADDVRAQARGLRDGGAPQRRAAGARVRAGRGRRDLRRGRHATPRSARPTRRGCWRGSGCAPRTISTQVVPRDRHAELLQAIALAGAGLERFATEIRHLQRTEVREVEEPFRAGPEGLERDAAQAQPDHYRAHLRPRARAARQRAGRGSRTSRCGTSATSRTPAPSGSILPDATILLDYMRRLALRVVRGMVVHADRMRAQPRASRRGALFSQRVLLALVERRDAARRGVPDRPAARRSRRGTRRRRCATLLAAARTSGSTSTRSSTTAATRATCRRCWRGWR